MAEQTPHEPVALEPSTDAEAPSQEGHRSRETVERLLRDHGALLHRYCVAMLAADGAEAGMTLIGAAAAEDPSAL